MGKAQEIKVPALGESVTEATVAKWMKQQGEAVNADEALVELETDKVTLEVGAPAAGVLSQITAQEGDTVTIGQILGQVEEGGTASASAPAPETPAPAPQAANDPTPAPAAPVAATAAAVATAPIASAQADLSPAVRKLIDENNLDPALIPGTGKDGRLIKSDVMQYLESGGAAAIAAASAPAVAPTPMSAPEPARSTNREERKRMTRLRQRIAERLKEAQNTAAILTTFNEVDMTEVMAIRAQYKEAFLKKHDVKLGFMSFFVKAAIHALKEIPAVNGEIDGEDIIYKNHYDIGVAVSAPQGLVVPVLRDADHLSFAGIEKTIVELGVKARDGNLSMEDLTGGTFTISNGGTFGSLVSTPILNPPQSGILGMHKIQERPMVVDGKIEIRPMMYLALSYDHRIIDGKEAVTFLVRIKDFIENPERLLLDM